MEIKITEVVNLGEALHVKATADGKEISTTINSPLMLDDPEKGLYNLLQCQALAPEIPDSSESVPVDPEDLPTVDEYVPDKERVDKVKKMEEKIKAWKKEDKTFTVEVASENIS